MTPPPPPKKKKISSKSSYPKKYSFFWKPWKILKFKILNKKMTRAYVCLKISEFNPPWAACHHWLIKCSILWIEIVIIKPEFDRYRVTGLFYYAYCVHVLVNLESRQTRIKLMFACFKHIHSLYPLQNFELVSGQTLARLHKCTGSHEPSLITFVISNCPYMLGIRVHDQIQWFKKVHGHCVEVLHLSHKRMCILLI